MEELLKFVEFLKSHYVIVAVVLGYFVQITPIPIYPFNWVKKLIRYLLKGIADEMTKGLKKAISDLKDDVNRTEQKVDNMDEKCKERDVKDDHKRLSDLRWKILSFADDVDKHFYKKETFDNIYDSHEEYDELLTKYEKTNGQVSRAMTKIDEFYALYSSDQNF